MRFRGFKRKVEAGPFGLIKVIRVKEVATSAVESQRATQLLVSLGR